MQFVNLTGNSVKLNDIGKVITFTGDQPQNIESDDVKRSKMFQMLCIAKKFKITSINSERIEQNLLRVQNGEMPIEEPKIDVIIRGHFFSNSGYGKANRNLVYALSRAGIRVGIETGNDASGLSEIELQRIARYRRCLPNAICIDSVIPSFASKSDYKYNILNTTVEAASIPQQFTDACNGYDEVWTTSDYCKNIFESSGVTKPVYVIPNSVDTKLYNESVQPHKFDPPLKKFVFVSVLSWSHRKGYDVLLKAYLDEFTENDDVSLLIVSKYDGTDEDDANKYIEYMTVGDHLPHVARCGRDVPEFEMPRLYKACDCFVLPSRGEGFGLPYVEASLCGLPIIATNHSGHTMFLKRDNSFLFDIDRLSILKSGKTDVHYWDGQLFPELNNSGELQKLMREVYTDISSAKRKNVILQRAVSQYSLESVGKLAAERLKDIWQDI